jgi:predicted Zn finger-like uncharacterized protein
MILSCNSCEKKFVVPDQAITATGRTVQCGSCGNKWKQFPIKSKESKIALEKKIRVNKTSSLSKAQNPKKKKIKKTREIDLYSPEYLAKKHGITLYDNSSNKKIKSIEKVTFGFYSSLILFIVIVITFSKSLHFFQDFIVQKLPFTEFYINYFFESIKNIFEIIKNLISDY